MSLNVWQRNIVDESGNTISGAEVEIFHSGSSTKPLIYSNSSGAVLTNPFGADISGFANFYAIDGFYDISINGVVLWQNVELGAAEYDTISQLQTARLSVGQVVRTKGCLSVGDGGHGVFDVVSSTLLSVNGYSVISFSHGVTCVLRPPYNLLQFGAVRNADSTAAILRARDFSSATKSPILLPSGTFLSGAINLNSDNIALIGENKNTSILKMIDGANANFITISASANNVVCENFSIDQNSTIRTPFGGNTIGRGLVLQGSQSARLKNLKIYNCSSNGIVIGANDKKFYMSDIDIEDTGATAFTTATNFTYFDGESTIENITIKNPTINISGYGFDIGGSATIKNVKISYTQSTVGLDGFRLRQGGSTALSSRGNTSGITVEFFATSPGTNGIVADGVVSNTNTYGNMSDLTVANASNAVTIGQYAFVNINNVVTKNILGDVFFASGGANINNVRSDTCGRFLRAESTAQNINISNFNVSAVTSAEWVLRASGTSEISFSNGSVPTGKIINGSGNISVYSVKGFRTRRKIYSDPIPVDTFGLKNVLIPHDMPFTPSFDSVMLTMYRDIDAAPVSIDAVLFRVENFVLTKVDAGFVYAKFWVLTPTTLAGETVRVVAHINSDYAMDK